MILRGEGTSGSLTVGSRPVGSSNIALVLEINEKQYELYSGILDLLSSKANFKTE
jgi:hypothetical protein